MLFFWNALFPPFFSSLLFFPPSFLFTLSYKVPAESYLSQLSWQDSPLYQEMQPSKRLSQLEPPIPAQGQQPLQIMDLWEQYWDPSTGRSYYVNSITKERSWKPPRRARGRTTNKVHTHHSQCSFSWVIFSLSLWNGFVSESFLFLKGGDKKALGWKSLPVCMLTQFDGMNTKDDLFSLRRLFREEWAGEMSTTGCWGLVLVGRLFNN